MLFRRGISFGSMFLIVFGKIMMKTKTDGTVACFLLNLSRDEKEENVRKSRETIFPFHNIIMYLLSQSYPSLSHSSAVCQTSLRIRIFSRFWWLRTKILLSNTTTRHCHSPPRLPPSPASPLKFDDLFIYLLPNNKCGGSKSTNYLSFHRILVLSYWEVSSIIIAAAMHKYHCSSVYVKMNSILSSLARW